MKTGRATPIASGVFLDALAIHGSKGMFGIQNVGVAELVQVGADGSTIHVGFTGHDSIDDLEFLEDGRLLAVDAGRRELLELDTGSGATTRISTTEIGLNSLGAINR